MVNLKPLPPPVFYRTTIRVKYCSTDGFNIRRMKYIIIILIIILKSQYRLFIYRILKHTLKTLATGPEL